MYLVAKPLIWSEAEVDHVDSDRAQYLVSTIRKSFTIEKKHGLYHNCSVTKLTAYFSSQLSESIGTTLNSLLPTNNNDQEFVPVS